MRPAQTKRAAALLLAVVATTVPAEAVAAPAPDAARWESVAAEIARPWPALQQQDGSFPDYMTVRNSAARDRYGDAMLGYGLLQTGVRQQDQAQISAALRALVAAASRRPGHHSLVFERMALAAAYNLARTQAASHPVFVANREVWERRLRGMRATWLGRSGRYFNQHLVDAVTIIELVRSGLRSDAPGTVLADPNRWFALAERLVSHVLPRLTRPYRSRFGPLTLAADGPAAYHALTLGFYARAISLLGRASGSSHRLLQAMGRASWALAGPDGAVAYFGRSLEQGWALSLTAYGAEGALPDAGAGWKPRLRALTRRTLERMDSLHVGGPYGLFLTPGFRRDFRGAIAAQDLYTSGTAYTGLALVGLEWTIERMDRNGAVPVGRLAADRAGVVRLGRDASTLGVMSTNGVWFAVRMDPGNLRDLRTDTGLMTLKVRDRRGRWRDVRPARPFTRGGLDSAGPVLRRHGRALPFGRSIRFKGTTAVLRAVFLNSAHRTVTERSIVFRPRPCGVDVLLRARRGERWEYSAFLPITPRPRRRGPHEINGGNQRARLRAPGHIRTGGLYRGVSLPRMTRAVLSAVPSRAMVGFALRARSCAGHGGK